MTRARIRLAVALTALAAIAFELALMRALAFRFWHHFAAMVIAVALLGFGASGTVLVFLRRRVARAPHAWLGGAAVAFALSVPISLHLSNWVRLDVPLLAWDRGQIWRALAIEAAMIAPFFLAALALGAALMDRPNRMPGHYGANLIGSGLGALGAVGLMAALTVEQLLAAVSLIALTAGAIAMPWRRRVAWVVAPVGLAALAVNIFAPARLTVSPYKTMPQLLAMPNVERVYQAEGPMGRLDVIEGPSIHHAPPMSIGYTRPLPSHALLLLDGEPAGAIYDCDRRDDWAFMDHTPFAAAHHLRPDASVLVIGAGGGAEVGLAVFHGSGRVAALEVNADVIAAVTGPLAERGGRIFLRPEVELIAQEARGYLTRTDEAFDLIQVPILEAFGAAGAGLYAAQESYLYTTEAVGLMLDHLSDRGVLSLTRWVKLPPRDGLRVFDTAAQALRRRGLAPEEHLAMVRGLMATTVLVSAAPLAPGDVDALRRFCRERSFDLCYAPGLAADETNQYNRLPEPYYYDAARELLSERREGFLAQYPFDVAATTDDRPYFGHFFGRRSLAFLSDQAGSLGRAHLEMGTVLLAVALAQTTVLAVILILLPLAPGLRSLRLTGPKLAALLYFLLLGAGFMLLEIGFLQKLILYLAHPVYAAAVAIASFLVFAGLGSIVSRRWPAGARTIGIAAGAVAVLGVAYALGLDWWLAATQGQALWLRFVLASVTVAPLALAMGHLFPTALRLTGSADAALVPWAWAVNGCASVVAAVAAPLLAMGIGFTRMTFLAVGLYVLAGGTGWLLPDPWRRRRQSI